MESKVFTQDESGKTWCMELSWNYHVFLDFWITLKPGFKGQVEWAEQGSSVDLQASSCHFLAVLRQTNYKNQTGLSENMVPKVTKDCSIRLSSYFHQSCNLGYLISHSETQIMNN